MNNLNKPTNNSAPLKPENLEKLIKNSNDLDDTLRWHIILDNKISIWVNIANKIFSPLKNFLILGLSGWYFIEDIINGDMLHKIIEFGLVKVNDYRSLLIICITIICIYFITKKYK